MQRVFHITTIANNHAAYDAMRASMTDAGFNDSNCRFTLLDNSKSNQFEPYSVLRQLATDADEPYIILCHQDLLFSTETTFTTLKDQISALDHLDQNWALAGIAGADAHGELVFHLDDSAGKWRLPETPRQVISLDESFLLLRRSHFVNPSKDLSGFHFYGADLCLNAFLDRKNAYVIAFPLHHLSMGNTTSADFVDAKEKFHRSWRDRLLLGLVRTSCSEIRIAPFLWLRRSLGGGRVKRFLRYHGICRIPRPWSTSSYPQKRHGSL